MAKKDFVRYLDLEWRDSIHKKAVCPSDMSNYFQGRIDLCNDLLQFLGEPRRDSMDELMESSRKSISASVHGIQYGKWYTVKDD